MCKDKTSYQIKGLKRPLKKKKHTFIKIYI